jgi:hypothetical protein
MNVSIDLYTRKGRYYLMRIRRDRLSQKILEVLSRVDEPLETVEIIKAISGTTRVKVLYRLHILRGESLIKGKQVGSGKGVWIWWKNNE